MRSRFLTLLATAALSLAPLAAQQAPSTDIWVGELVRSGDSWRLENPRNLTDRDGYDNQPWFLPDGHALLYASQRDGQTDIFEIDLSSRATRPATRTPESEFSPQLAPDLSGISVVRVEGDGTQRIWSFPLSGREPLLVAPAARGVGYYAWIDASTLVAFVLGEPFTLQRIDLATGRQRVVARDVGRSLARLPSGGGASFTARDGEDSAIFAYDAAADETHRLAPLPAPESQDYAWTPEGDLIAGDGSRLLHLRPGHDEAWLPFADLARLGVRGVTRLAVSADGRHLAFVAER